MHVVYSQDGVSPSNVLIDVVEYEMIRFSIATMIHMVPRGCIMKPSEEYVQTYLSAVKEGVSEDKYTTHRSVIWDLLNWCDGDVSREHVTEQLAGQYIQKRCDIDGVQDVSDLTTVLENFVAYAKQSDPGVVALNISEERVYAKTELSNEELHDPPIPPSKHDHPWAQATTDETTGDEIRELRTFLDEHRYATVAHAYLEILLASGRASHDHVNVSIDDLDLAAQIIRLEHDSESLVTELELVTDHVAPLSPYTTNVLRTYLEQYRSDEVGTKNTTALFVRDGEQLSKSALLTILSDAVSDAVEHANDTMGSSAIENFEGDNGHDLTPHMIARKSGVPPYVDPTEHVYPW